MGAKDDLSCRDLKNGIVGSLRVRLTSKGGTISTRAVGTPERFMGNATLKEQGKPILKTPIDSENLGENSLAGAAAAVGKQQLQKCWGKVGPTI